MRKGSYHPSNITKEFLLNSEKLEVRLTSEYPQLKLLAEQIIDRLFATRSAREKSKKVKAAKGLLANLWFGYRHNRPIAVPRSKKNYALDNRLGQLFFKYDCIVPIVDELAKEKFIYHKKGFQDPKSEKGFVSRIWWTPKLGCIFKKLDQQAKIENIEPLIWEDRENVIHLKNEKGKRIYFEIDKSNERGYLIDQINKLKEYNKIISNTEIDIRSNNKFITLINKYSSYKYNKEDLSAAT